MSRAKRMSSSSKALLDGATTPTVIPGLSALANLCCCWPLPPIGWGFGLIVLLFASLRAGIVVAVLSTPALMTPLTNVRLFMVMLPLRQWRVEN